MLSSHETLSKVLNSESSGVFVCWTGFGGGVFVLFVLFMSQIGKSPHLMEWW